MQYSIQFAEPEVVMLFLILLNEFAKNASVPIVNDDIEYRTGFSVEAPFRRSSSINLIICSSGFLMDDDSLKI